MGRIEGGNEMETKVIHIEVKLTQITLAVLLSSVLLVAGLLIAGAALAESPEPRPEVPEAEQSLAATDYDASLFPQLPRKMNYQGVLKDDGGNPLDGSHELTLTIYRYSPAIGIGWQAVYSETQTVEVNDGLFNVIIGDSTPLNPGVFGGLEGLMAPSREGNLELGIRVDGGTELTPRVKLLTVPYAFRAEYVNRFPAPHYDSGWTPISQAETVTFDHNLDGNVDDYVVDMTCESTTGMINYGINQINYGGNTAGTSQFGAYWRNLTASAIRVYRASDDTTCNQVRIRIWRIE
jgi:hypothetical protein